MQNDSSSQSFLDVMKILSSGTSVDEAVQVIQLAYGFKFVTYHLAQQVDKGVDAPFVKTTYPAEWLGRYVMRGYVEIDPVVLHGFTNLLPFDWSEVEMTEAGQAVIEDAMAHGLMAFGYSIPIIDKLNRRALLSVNGAIEEMDAAAWACRIDAVKSELSELAYQVHKLAVFELHGDDDGMPNLGPRERECLMWASRGKDSKAIGIILNLSENTVRSYLKSIRNKLGCANIAQATAKAVQLRLIRP